MGGGGRASAKLFLTVGLREEEGVLESRDGAILGGGGGGGVMGVRGSGRTRKYRVSGGLRRAFYKGGGHISSGDDARANFSVHKGEPGRRIE